MVALYFEDDICGHVPIPVSPVEEVKELSAVDLKEADPDSEPRAVLAGLHDGKDVVGSQEVEARHIRVAHHGVGLARPRLPVSKAGGLPSRRHRK